MCLRFHVPIIANKHTFVKEFPFSTMTVVRAALKHNAIFFHQLSRRFQRIYTGAVLDGSEFMISLHFKGQTIVHHMNHVQNQFLKFVSIWLHWFYLAAILIHIGDFLLYDMNRHMFIHYFFQLSWFIHN